jgi:hypothetical protein
MGFNWESATASEIVVLYEAIRELLKPKALTWKQVFAEASPNIQTGTDYERNFRRGKIAPKRAEQIFEWLERRFPETAAYVEELLTSVHTSIDTNSPWERFIEEHGVFSDVELRVIRIEERVQSKPSNAGSKIELEELKQIQAQYELKLHTRFTFKIESPFRGLMCVLQWSRGVWWPIPLNPLTCWTEVKKGPHWVPYDPSNDDGRAPHLLTEHTEDGLHRLAFLITTMPHPKLTDADPQQRLDQDRLNQIANTYLSEPANSWRLMRLNVLFKALDAP